MSRAALTPAEELVALRASYLASLPGRVDELAAAIDTFNRSPEPRIALDKATDLAHRLRGTSGSYGAASFSRTIGAVEEALRGVDASGDARSRWETMAAIEAALALAKSFAKVALASATAGRDGP